MEIAMIQTSRRALLAGAATLAALPAGAAGTPGVTATEILFGQTMPYSGPASSYGTIGKASDAYFKMINDQGGINGRMLRMLSLDDGYLPPKTVELTRRMIEEDKVAFLFNCLGTPTNNATRKYTNSKKVPDFSSPPAPPSSAIGSTIPGRWAGSQPTRSRAASMPNTSCAPRLTPRSACSTRATIPAATTSRA
jgi:ABC-type branched-subunit amino acid transport system substrate-binding protein